MDETTDILISDLSKATLRPLSMDKMYGHRTLPRPHGWYRTMFVLLSGPLSTFYRDAWMSRGLLPESMDEDS